MEIFNQAPALRVQNSHTCRRPRIPKQLYISFGYLMQQQSVDKLLKVLLWPGGTNTCCLVRHRSALKNFNQTKEK